MRPGHIGLVLGPGYDVKLSMGLNDLNFPKRCLALNSSVLSYSLDENGMSRDYTGKPPVSFDV